MLSGLILENFKAFGGRHPIIPLAPITLIFGANSAGKSSIIDALALPQINKLDRKKGIGSDIVSNLSYVVLQDDVFNNDTTLDSSVTIHISKDDINSQSVLDYAMRSIPKRFHNKVSLVINIKNVYSRDPISIQYGENGCVSITQEGWDAVNSSDLLKITHIGSIRDVTGYQDSGQPNYLRGSHSREDLLIITALSINRSSLLINKLLEQFDTQVSLKGGMGSYRLEFTDMYTGAKSGIQGVGEGIAQSLPSLLRCTVSQNETIVIEQPELHLHPKLQAELGSIFANSYLGRGNQFIIETHSEHLILRLQLLIAEGVLTPNDVSVLYVSRDKNGSHCKQIPLDKYGEFEEEWPEGFFEESFNESLARLQLRKTRR